MKIVKKTKRQTFKNKLQKQKEESQNEDANAKTKNEIKNTKLNKKWYNFNIFVFL